MKNIADDSASRDTYFIFIQDDSDDSDVVCIGSDIEECEIEDTANSGLHTGDNFNHIDDQGRVLSKYKRCPLNRKN